MENKIDAFIKDIKDKIADIRKRQAKNEEKFKNKKIDAKDYFSLAYYLECKAFGLEDALTSAYIILK